MDLYKEYVQEREKLEVIWDADSFISYKQLSEKELYINDMFIKKSARRSGKARELIGVIKEIAKSKGCKVLSGAVRLNDPGASNTMLAALKIGFKIFGANEAGIIIAIELED